MYSNPEFHIQCFISGYLDFRYYFYLPCKIRLNIPCPLFQCKTLENIQNFRICPLMETLSPDCNHVASVPLPDVFQKHCNTMSAQFLTFCPIRTAAFYFFYAACNLINNCFRIKILNIISFDICPYFYPMFFLYWLCMKMFYIPNLIN